MLVTWENEGILAVNELGKDKFDIVYPSLSILAEPPVAVVDKVIEKRGTRLTAQAYLDYLYSRGRPAVAAPALLRPTADDDRRYDNPDCKLVTIDDTFGGWQKAQREPFRRWRHLRPDLPEKVGQAMPVKDLIRYFNAADSGRR